MEGTEREERNKRNRKLGIEGTEWSDDDDYVVYSSDGAQKSTVQGIQPLELN